MPDEWQARQTIPAIFQVSSSMHNAKKITTRAGGPFHQSITAILTEEKREVCVCVCVRERERKAKDRADSTSVKSVIPLD